MRLATEADIPWLVEYAREMHGVVGLGPYDEEYSADVARACRVLIDGDGMLGGMELPGSSSPVPAVNHVVFWNSKGAAWRLLAAHEASSPLPTTLTVPVRHERYRALLRALKGRGYEEHEMLMVKK